MSGQQTGRQSAARAAVGAILVSLALLGLGACGFGVGPGEQSGSAELRVSRDFGAEVLVEVAAEPLTESDTVMRVLDRNAEIESRYGGGFVQSINGLEGGNEAGRPYDWLFFVNGIESDRGGADYQLSDGDRIWWDYRDWGAAMRVPAVVGQFPEPFLKGFDNETAPRTVVECRAGGEACDVVSETLKKAGAELESEAETATRVLVGQWAEIAAEKEAAALARGPLQSGVYLRIEAAGATGGGGAAAQFIALDGQGREVSRYGAGYGLVAATRRGERPPFWIVTGIDTAGLAAAAAAVNEDDLANHFAILVGPDGPIPLPRP